MGLGIAGGRAELDAIVSGSGGEGAMACSRDNDIGVELVEARARREPWKVLMRRYGYGRTRLWMLWRATLDEAMRERKDCVETPALRTSF